METMQGAQMRTAGETGSTRRRTLAGLGALVLSAIGVVGLAPEAAASRNRRQCIEDCVASGGSNQLRQRRKRCRRRCHNR